MPLRVSSLPRCLVFLLRHLPLTGGPAESEGLVDVVQNVRHGQTPLQFVSKQPAGPASLAGAGRLVVVDHLGHVDGTDGSNVQTILTGRQRPTLAWSPHLARTLTPLQVHH